MESITEIIKLVFTPAAIIASLVYLFQKYFEKALNKNLEKYKNDLKTELELTKAKLQNELDIKLFEYQTKFSLFHQKQATITAELYKKLYYSSNSIVDLTKPIQIGGQKDLNLKKKETAEILNDLINFFNENRIYFNEEICKKLDEIIKVIRDALIEFDIAHNFGMNGSESYKKDDSELWLEAWKIINTKLPTINKELEKFLRDILTFNKNA